MPDIDLSAIRAGQVFYDVATQRLAQQLGEIDGLDAKSSSVFAAGSTILAIITTLFAVGDQTAVHLDNVSKLLLIIGVIAYVPLIVAFVSSYRTRSWQEGPDLDDLIVQALTWDDRVMRIQVAEACTESYRNNQAKLARKLLYLNVALYALAIETIALVTAGLESILR